MGSSPLRAATAAPPCVRVEVVRFYLVASMGGFNSYACAAAGHWPAAVDEMNAHGLKWMTDGGEREDRMFFCPVSRTVHCLMERNMKRAVLVALISVFTI